MTRNYSNCWVINVNDPLDCWLIDEDRSKPIYLENDWPRYDRSRLMQYRLSNQPTEEYLEKHPQINDDGQMSIFDFMEEDVDGTNRPDYESNK